MKKAVVWFMGLGLVLAIAVISYSADATAGKAIYTAQKCQMCHSIAGVGNKKSPLDGVGAKLKAEEIKKWIKTPKEMKAATTMKAYPTLPDKQLEDLTAYLLTLK